MDNTRTIYIPITPMAAPRPRFRAIPKGPVVTYMPKEYKAWQDQVRNYLRGGFIADMIPLGTPVEVGIEMSVPRPKTTKLTAPKWDVDNGAKAVLDCLSGIVFHDDCQVEILHVVKRWSDEADDTPGYILVHVTPMGATNVTVLNRIKAVWHYLFD
jgi:Holliday junction resolvase RusA-like endonuclease